MVSVVADRLMITLGRTITGLGPRISQGLQQAGLIVERGAKIKVSGEVLRVRTGRLRSSIQTGTPMETEPGHHEIAVGTSVVYARIHELGGTIPARTVRPVRARALHFVMGGQDIFAMSASIPAVHMPQRPFLVPALHEHAAEIRAVFEQAVTALLEP